MPIGLGTLALVGLAGDIYGASKGASAQRAANKTNIMLAREQRAWEETLSNTAVQRRADDIQKAGFNRVLAATGAGASTPSVSAPTVEPTFRPEWTKGTGATALQAMTTAAQVQNLQAQTEFTKAQTAGQNIKNHINNAFAYETAALNRDLKQMSKQATAKEYELLEQNLKNAVQQGANLAIAGKQSAAELERFNLMTRAVVGMAYQQARIGELDMEALERLAETFGTDPSRWQSIARSILDAFRVFTKGH